MESLRYKISLLASLELASILVLLYFYGIREVRDIGLLAGTIALVCSSQKSRNSPPDS